jgi:hypothetical protein
MVAAASARPTAAGANGRLTVAGDFISVPEITWLTAPSVLATGCRAATVR